MDVAKDFTIGIWVVAVEVATVGVDAAGGIGLMGEVEVGVVSKGWVITPTLYPLLAGALTLLFFSAFLGTKVLFISKLFWRIVLVCGCNWGWGWSFGMGQACLQI